MYCQGTGVVGETQVSHQQKKTDLESKLKKHTIQYKQLTSPLFRTSAHDTRMDIVQLSSSIVGQV